MSLSEDYSANWKDLGNAILYKTMDFQFLSTCIITEFEGCLVNKISNAKLYHNINQDSMVLPIHNQEFIKQITNDAKDASIIILSNQICNSKISIDALKRKFESFMSVCKLPMLALFALKPDRLCKPHTGMWNLINSYYKANNHLITNGRVVSDFGGRVITIEKKNGKEITKYDKTDTDRAFAYNIGIKYQTIAEYLDRSKKEKFNWNTSCLQPEIRKLYAEKLNQYKNPNIFAKLAELGQSETYMIMIYGAPRAGKTTLAKDILKRWRSSGYGAKHAIKRFDRLNYSKAKRINQANKALNDRISVIIDGECHTDDFRAPFLEMAKNTATPVLHIEVNSGIGMAYIFNHVAVEESKTDGVFLYPEKDYFIYKSLVKRLTNAVLYCPVIIPTIAVMEFRY